MKLRSQVFLYFGIYMIVIITAIFYVDYNLIKHHLKNKAEEDLKVKCEKIYQTIQTTLNSAIENYLRGITESNLDVVKNYYQKYINGELSESEAKDAIQDHCNRQSIGTSGYIVAVENKEGELILDIHPFKRHEDCSETTGCEVWDRVRNGYVEYDWKNPEDNKYRKKVAYLKEFPEWNWVFGATSYKSEFTQLLNIENLKSILALEKTEGSSYPILYDSNKNILFHPMLEKYQDESFLKEQSSIADSILAAPGKITFYKWKNPKENKPREKFAYTQVLNEFGFYLIVSGYMSEVYSPLKNIIYITILLSVTAALLLLLAVLAYSKKVVTPIHALISGIKKYYSDKTPFKIPNTSVKELNTLAFSFYKMTKEIGTQMNEKQMTIEKMQQINIQLEKAKKKAEESDHLKSAFLANMSHEIRTPMNAILGFTSLLKNPQLAGESQSQFIEIIEKSGERMLDTINDIIDISKIEAGQVEVVMSKVSVNKILEEEFSLFSKEAEAKGLQLIYEPTVKENKLQIITDKQKLESILTNLIKNAIKYTEHGTVTFGCSVTPNQENEELEFFVKDTGIGVPADRVEAIFNRFEQSDIEDRMVFEGSGLGLAISKSYTEMLGGSIGVTSNLGVGSTFKFTIPYILSNKNRETNKETNTNKGKTDTSWSYLTILIAEDDDVNKQFFASVFENLFSKIIFTSTGKETIEAVRENPSVSIILMDIKMPEMNGYDATRVIRTFNKDVVIIAQTAYGFDMDRKKALEAGCNDYLSKPIKPEDLIKIIDKHLNK